MEDVKSKNKKIVYSEDKKMPTIYKIPIIVALVIFTIIILNFMFIDSVPIGKIGVKLNKWGGIVKEDYKVGYHFSMIGLHEWRFLNSTTQFINFSKHVREGEPLIIRTKDNNEIYIDVTIPYRIIEKEGWKVVKGGLEATYKDRVKLIAKSILRAYLAQLSPANIIHTDFRETLAKKTLPELNKKLSVIHIRAESILIRGFYFINKKVERTIQEKQYLRQGELLKKAQLKENIAKLNTNKIETEILNAEKKVTEEANKRIEELKAKYQIEIAKIEKRTNVYNKQTRSEGDSEREIMISEGKLSLAKAEALKIKLEASLLRSKGGKIFMAKQAAENLKMGDIILNSNIKNPLNSISLKTLLKVVQP